MYFHVCLLNLSAHLELCKFKCKSNYSANGRVILEMQYFRAEGAFTGTAAAPGPEISDFPRGIYRCQILA